MSRFGGLLAAVIWIAGAVPVFAEHFSAARQVKVGMKLVLFQPETLLLLAVCGLLISYSRRRDALIGFAALLAGMLLGFPLVFIWQAEMLWVALILTFVFGGAVAMNYFLPARIQRAYLVLAGACCAPLGFIGHYYSETTPLLLGGYVLSLIVVAGVAYLVCAVLRGESERYRWTAILLRIFGSWAFAASLMIFAFNMVRP